LSEEEVDQIFKKRYAFINVWRTCDDSPVVRRPLALCDYKTVDYNNLPVYELRYPDRVGSIHCFDADDETNKKHEWWYFPQITKEEAIVFFCYDSKPGGP
jgi:hypothetical protein